MAIVARVSTASLDANQRNQTLAGNAYAGEDLDAVAPCYIKSSDGYVYMSDGAANNEAAEFIGFTARAHKSGEAVALFGWGTRFHPYGSGLTPGDVYYVRDADAYYGAGNLDTVATPGDSAGTAVALNDTDIMVIRTKVKGG